MTEMPDEDRPRAVSNRSIDVHHLSTPDQKGLLAGEHRLDFDIIVGLIESGSRVLDLGCGDGVLLARVRDERRATVRGVELSQAGVKACIGRGISVFQGDLDEGLADFPDGSFDYVILSQTLQVVHRPDLLLTEMLRVAETAIVSFPNFGHWRTRWSLAASGRLPKTRALPYEWYDTPNIRLVTIPDFLDLVRRLGLRAGNVRALGGHPPRALKVLRNLRAEFALFVVTR